MTEIPCRDWHVQSDDFLLKDRESMKRMRICEEYRHNRSIENEITNINFHVMYIYIYIWFYMQPSIPIHLNIIYTSSDVSTSTVSTKVCLCQLGWTPHPGDFQKDPVFVGQLDSDNKKHHPPTQAYVSILSKVLWRIWCKMRIYLRFSRGDLPFYGTNLPKYGVPFGIYIYIYACVI